MAAPVAPSAQIATQPVALPRPQIGAPSRGAARAPLLLAALAFMLYAFGAAPGMYWLDSQELGAAGVQLGVPHPTGFPLFCLAARVAAWLPFGELAFRVHLVSALCTAIAVGVTTRLATELAGGDRTAVVAGVAAGTVLGGSAVVARSATVTEVYAPTLALLALALWLTVRVARSGDRHLGLALCFVCGLGALGVHGSFRLIMVLPVLALLAWQLRGGARWPLLGPALAALGALGVVVYLPLRSASGQVPLLDWGHPRTLGALWDHAISAARITNAFGEEMFRAATTAPEALRVATAAEADLGVLALLLGGVGLVVMLARPRLRLAGALVLLVIAIDAAYAIWVNPMGQVERQNGVPLALGVALAAAVGVAALARRFFRAAPYVAAVLAAMIAVPAVLADGGAKRALAASDAPRAWDEAVLDAAPPRAVALVQADNLAAGLFWLQLVEGQRPDVASLVRQHAADRARTEAVLARVAPIAAVPDVLAGDQRAVLWDLGQDRLPRGYRGELALPAMRLRRADAPVIDDARLAIALDLLARVFPPGVTADENARRQHGRAFSNLGRVLLEARRPEAAERLFAAAHATDDENPVPLTNLGVLAAARGDHAAAAEFTEAALARDATSLTARINAARYRLALGDDTAAARHAEAALALAPRRAEVHALLGVIAARAGDVALARRRFEQALALDPDEPDARANLARLPAP